jgi:hypothetical protein
LAAKVWKKESSSCLIFTLPEIMKGHLRIHDNHFSTGIKNHYKSSEMQAGSGSKKKLSCWPFVKFLTYFCG